MRGSKEKGHKSKKMIGRIGKDKKVIGRRHLSPTPDNLRES